MNKAILLEIKYVIYQHFDMLCNSVAGFWILVACYLLWGFNQQPVTSN